MNSRLNEIVDSGLAHVYSMFEAHPEMQKLLRDMSFAVCSDLGGVSPEHNLFPRLLAEKGVRFFEANFNAILGQVQSLDADFRIDCSEGCSYCCSSHITVMPQEAFNIGLHLAQKWGESDFTALAEECLETADHLEKTTLKEFTQNYFQPCPFLKENRCSIYEVRPIVCRNWISSSLEICIKSFESRNKIAVPQNAMIMVQKDLVFVGQEAYLADFGISGRIGSFLPLMAQVMTDFEGAYDRWLKGEVLTGQMG